MSPGAGGALRALSRVIWLPLTDLTVSDSPFTVRLVPTAKKARFSPLARSNVVVVGAGLVATVDEATVLNGSARLCDTEVPDLGVESSGWVRVMVLLLTEATVPCWLPTMTGSPG